MIRFSPADEALVNLPYTSVVCWSHPEVERDIYALKGSSVLSCILLISAYDSRVQPGDYVNFTTAQGIISFIYNGKSWEKKHV